MSLPFDRRRTTRLFNGWSRTSPAASPRISPSLGDKLQVLAGRSPWHLRIVEALVDQFLLNLDRRVAPLLIVGVSLWNSLSDVL